MKVITTTDGLRKKHVTDKIQNVTRLELLDSLLTQLGPSLDQTPAARKGRLAYEGGLCTHIDEIITWMLISSHNMPGGHKLTFDSIVTVALLHDMYKVTDGAHHPYFVQNILSDGEQSPKVPYKINKETYMQWDNNADNPINKLKVSGDHLERYAFQMITTDRLDSNPGIMSSAVVYSIEPQLWESLSQWEQDAIKFYGMAFSTSKNQLQHVKNPLMTLLHCGDMLSYMDVT